MLSCSGDTHLFVGLLHFGLDVVPLLIDLVDFSGDLFGQLLLS